MLSLNRDEKLIRANEILHSKDLKQSICNEILGCTFKDIEKAMTSILEERQLSQEKLEELELKAMAPEKFDLEFEIRVNKRQIAESDGVSDGGPYKYRTYTREEVAKLLAASRAPVEYSPPPERTEYEPMSREECERLVREHYEYKERERLKKEAAQWDSLKTIELEVKTKFKTKPSKSTKD